MRDLRAHRRPGSGPARDSLEAYLDDISRHDLLTPEDERRLGAAIEAGRRAAREIDEEEEEEDGGLPPDRLRHLRAQVAECQRSTRRFIEANLRLVVAIAKRYRSSGVPLADLIQEGNIGLIHAVGRFDHRRGVRFSTYAAYWIRQSIARAVTRVARAIRLPDEVDRRLSAVRRARTQLEVALGRAPTVEEVAALAGLPVAAVRDVERHDTPTASLDAPLGDAGAVGDRVPDDRAAQALEEAVARLVPSAVAGLLAQLGDRDREVLCLRFGLAGDRPHSAAAVGRRLGISEERVRQIERRALDRLRPHLAELEARDLLDR